MTRQNRFGISLLGFDKDDVNSYIEKILREFDEKLREKDEEINYLKNQYIDYKTKYDKLSTENHETHEDKSKIADVLIKAQEKAGLIIEDAKKKAQEESNKLNKECSGNRETLQEMINDVMAIKELTVSTLKKYQNDLALIIEIEDQENVS